MLEPRPEAPAISARAEVPAFSFSSGSSPNNAVICPRCATRNPASGRFCVSCGAALGETPAPPQARPVAPAPVASPAPPIVATPQPVDPLPVQPVAVVHVVPDPGPAPSASVICDRCQGVCDIGMRFCKFCGAPLAHLADPQRVQPSTLSGESKADYGPTPSARQGLQAAIEEAARQATTPKPAQASPPASTQDEAYDRPTPLPEAPAAVSGSTGSYGAFAGMQPPIVTGRLIVIAGDGQEGPSFPLVGDQVDIGRTEGTVVLPDDRYMSARHARLVRVNSQWLVRDLGSTNGVFVRMRKPHELVDTDLLLLGVEVLRFETTMEAEQGFGPAIQHGTWVFGSPALPRTARLVQRTVEGVARDVYHLHRAETVIGRESGDIVFTDDPYMSRRHASIQKNSTSGRYTLVDLDSSNGTFVAIRSEYMLLDGDSIRVGQHLFRVELTQG